MAYIFKCHIADILSELTKVDRESLLPLIFQPSAVDRGQFTLSVFKLLPLLQKCSKQALSLPIKATPEECAKRLLEMWPRPDEQGLVESVTCEAARLGFHVSKLAFFKIVFAEAASGLLFTLRSSDLCKPIADAQSAGAIKVVVEFELPAPGQEFDSMHWRSLCMADFQVRACRAQGMDVTSRCRVDLHLPGTGVMLLALKLHSQTLAIKLHSQRDCECSIRRLREIYQKTLSRTVNDSKLSQEAASLKQDLLAGASDVMSRWLELWRVWIESIAPGLDKMGFNLELKTDELAPFAELLSRLEEAGILDGLKIADLTEWKLGTVSLWSDGPTRALLDLAAAVRRSHAGISKTYIVGPKGREYATKQTQRLVAIVIPNNPVEIIEIQVGKIEGLAAVSSPTMHLDIARLHMQRIASAKAATLDDRTDEHHDSSESIGRAALLVQIHLSRRFNDFTFDWRRITDDGGNNGIYMQYTHARLSGIIANVDLTSHLMPMDFTPLLLTPAAYELAVLISRYPYVLHSAVTASEPSILASYLLRLCHATTSSLGHLRVKDMQRSIQLPRAELMIALRSVIKWGLRWIGVQEVNRM
ncbi:hypothetical protein DFJ77DRAFT_75172 [Powellomyces hirtus]|nr:hypothetical protein DFJ77DRAFT_75172 [Powellomyces hirtus]